MLGLKVRNFHDKYYENRSRPLAVIVRETEKFQTVDFALPNGRPETDILTVPGYILEETLYIKSNNLTKTNSLNNYNARFKDLFAEQHRLLFLEKYIKMSWSYDILRFNN